MHLNKENEALCKAIGELQTLKPDLPLKEQLVRLLHSTREAINYKDDAKIQNKKMLAHKRQQRLVNSHTKQANKRDI